ncbi:MAG: hypothetical protein M3Z32_00020 [Acidobacteriota bacterium]|nr:hypothetical protein [Acidobacteriota bacterium]
MSYALAIFMLAFDISGAKAQPDLEKRSELALANADSQVDAARQAYRAGELSKMEAALDELRDSANLSLVSLEQANKKARNNKYYKRAELKIRALLRRLSSLRDEVGLDDRKPIEAVLQRLQEVHEQVLVSIMSKR